MEKIASIKEIILQLMPSWGTQMSELVQATHHQVGSSSLHLAISIKQTYQKNKKYTLETQQITSSWHFQSNTKFLNFSVLLILEQIQ